MTAIADPFAGEFDRLPPHSIEAEMCLIASLIVGDETAFVEVRGIVDRDMFYQADHQIIFDTVCAMRAAGHNVDAFLVREELAKRQQLDEIGGVAYLGEILSTVPSAEHATEYATLVRETALRRILLTEANDLIRRVYTPHGDDNALEIGQEAVKRISDRVLTGAQQRIHEFGDVAEEVYEQLQKAETTAIKTLFYDLDSMTGGIYPGEELLIGARPSMGKSTWVRQVAAQIALSGVPVGYISLEESRHKIARNLMSVYSGVDNNRLRRGLAALSADDWKAVAAGVLKLGKIPLYIVDDAFKMVDIAAQASVMAARFGIKVLIVDYLQRIRGGRAGSRYEEITNVSLDLSALIKRLGVAGVVVVQLNRSTEHRTDHRPTMSDIRETGQIEQDADGILFLHREDYYHIDDGSRQPDGVAELIVAKWRDGIRGKTIKLQSNLRTQEFRNVASSDRYTDASWE